MSYFGRWSSKEQRHYNVRDTVVVNINSIFIDINATEGYTFTPDDNSTHKRIIFKETIDSCLDQDKDYLFTFMSAKEQNMTIPHLGSTSWYPLRFNDIDLIKNLNVDIFDIKNKDKFNFKRVSHCPSVQYVYWEDIFKQATNSIA